MEEPSLRERTLYASIELARTMTACYLYESTIVLGLSDEREYHDRRNWRNVLSAGQQVLD